MELHPLLLRAWYEMFKYKREKRNWGKGEECVDVAGELVSWECDGRPFES